MKCTAKIAAAVAVLAFGLAAQAQQTSTGTASKSSSPQQMTVPTPQAGYFYVPESSKQTPPGFYHTNYVIRTMDGKKPAGLSAPKDSGAVYGPVIAAEDGIGPLITTEEIAETPDSMGCLYVHSPSSSGCVPKYVGGPSSGGYGAIALVDAYDNPDAATDLSTFDSYWGLAAASFTKIYANGNGDCGTPPANAGWAGEESLDIEWAHVFAPKAAIVLVEACSSSGKDLYYAEQVAFSYIVANYTKAGGGQVSNSWTGDEYSGESSNDPLFADFNYTCCSWTAHITAFASAGDCGYLNETNNGPCYSPGNNNYPSVNPWVVSAGGTSVLRNASTGAFYSEACWSGSGGGPAAFEKWSTSGGTGGNLGAWAPYQYPIFGDGINYGTGLRAVPDLAFNADPASGVWVYSAYGFGGGGWAVIGGTSVSSPSLAGIVNRAGNKLGTVYIEPIVSGANFSAWENNLLYSQLATAATYKGNLYDIKTGSNGGPGAKAGYDECTGVGSPRGTAVK
jgi:kumamolisin